MVDVVCQTPEKTRPNRHLSVFENCSMRKQPTFHKWRHRWFPYKMTSEEWETYTNGVLLLSKGFGVEFFFFGGGGGGEPNHAKLCWVAPPVDFVTILTERFHLNGNTKRFFPQIYETNCLTIIKSTSERFKANKLSLHEPFFLDTMYLFLPCNMIQFKVS